MTDNVTIVCINDGSTIDIKPRRKDILLDAGYIAWNDKYNVFTFDDVNIDIVNNDDYIEELIPYKEIDFLRHIAKNYSRIKDIIRIKNGILIRKYNYKFVIKNDKTKIYKDRVIYDIIKRKSNIQELRQEIDNSFYIKSVKKLLEDINEELFLKLTRRIGHSHYVISLESKMGSYIEVEHKGLYINNVYNRIPYGSDYTIYNKMIHLQRKYKITIPEGYIT